MPQPITVSDLHTMFDAATVTREELLRHVLVAAKSNKMTAGMACQIGILRGFSPFTKAELNPGVTFDWIVTCDDPYHFTAPKLYPEWVLEKLGDFGNHIQPNKSLFHLCYNGARPPRENIYKRMREYGLSREYTIDWIK